MPELVKYDEMCRAIATVRDIDEVKDIRDQAYALEAYARQAQNLEAEEKCKEIRFRAEREWGRRYELMEKAKGARGNPGGQGAPIVRSDHTTAQSLSDMHVTKDQSARWQKLAKVPDDEFELAIAERRVEQLTAKPEKEAPIEPVGANVLWLWGRLREFRDRGLLDEEHAYLASTATEHMLKEIDELAPLVANWLLDW